MTGRQQTTDTLVVAEWSDSPFTGIGKRHHAIEHRVVIDHHGGVGVDVRHEVRSDDYDGCSDSWTPAEVYEAREHGIDKVGREEGWWL